MEKHHQRMHDNPAELLPRKLGYPRRDGNLPAERDSRSRLHTACGGRDNRLCRRPNQLLGSVVDQAVGNRRHHGRMRRRELLSQCCCHACRNGDLLVESQAWISLFTACRHWSLYRCASGLLGAELDRAVGSGRDHGRVWRQELLSRLKCNPCGDGGLFSKDFQFAIALSD